VFLVRQAKPARSSWLKSQPEMGDADSENNLTKSTWGRVARYLGVITSAVNRMANAEELPNVRRYIKIIGSKGLGRAKYLVFFGKG